LWKEGDATQLKVSTLHTAGIKQHLTCRRTLHPVIVVKNIKDVQQFYTSVLGMRTLRYRSFRDGSANGFSGVVRLTPMALEFTMAAIPVACCVGTL
jgi:hypothetical protein